MASNKKMQEYKPTLKLNFTWEYILPVLILGIFCSDGPVPTTYPSSHVTLKAKLFVWKDSMQNLQQQISAINWNKNKFAKLP